MDNMSKKQSSSRKQEAEATQVARRQPLELAMACRRLLGLTPSWFATTIHGGSSFSPRELVNQLPQSHLACSARYAARRPGKLAPSIIEFASPIARVGLLLPRAWGIQKDWGRFLEKRDLTAFKSYLFRRKTYSLLTLKNLNLTSSRTINLDGAAD